jgi:hypothetical protein
MSGFNVAHTSDADLMQSVQLAKEGAREAKARGNQKQYEQWHAEIDSMVAEIRRRGLTSY